VREQAVSAINKNQQNDDSSMPKATEKRQTMDEVLGSLPPDQKEIAQSLRALIKSAVPEAVELVKQGRIIYKLVGKDFVWISTSNHMWTSSLRWEQASPRTSSKHGA
jgi:hypothetical protein